jgi:hypothetical protein
MIPCAQHSTTFGHCVGIQLVGIRGFVHIMITLKLVRTHMYSRGFSFLIYNTKIESNLSQQQMCYSASCNN